MSQDISEQIEDYEHSIKLWRRIRIQNNQSQLKELHSANEMGKNVLLVLPGTGTQHPKENSGNEQENAEAKQIAGYIKVTEKLLRGGSPNPAVDILAISYGDTEHISSQTDFTNASKEYIDPDVRDFTLKYILPLTESGSKITLLGHSVGSIVAENIERSLREYYTSQGVPQKQIQQKLASITSLMMGNTSARPDLYTLEPNANTGFRTIVFNNIADRFAQDINPNFGNIIPSDYQPGHISIDRLSANSLLVSAFAPSNTLIWKEENSGSAIERIKGAGHSINYFATRNMNTPPGFVLALERAVCHAVDPDGKPVTDVQELLSKPTRGVPPQPLHHSATNRSSLEDLEIARALYSLRQKDGMNKSSSSHPSGISPQQKTKDQQQNLLGVGQRWS